MPVTCERTLTLSNASTLPIAATSTGTSRCWTVATVTGTRPPSPPPRPPRPRPPPPRSGVDADASVRLHAENAAQKRNARTTVAARADLVIYKWHTKIAAAAFTGSGFLRDPLRCLDDRTARHKRSVGGSSRGEVDNDAQRISSRRAWRSGDERLHAGVPGAAGDQRRRCGA